MWHIFLYVVNKSDVSRHWCNLFYFCIINWYTKSNLQRMRLSFLILKIINHFINLWTSNKFPRNLYSRLESRRLKRKSNVLPSAWITCCNFVSSCNFYLLKLLIIISTSKAPYSDTNGSAVYISFWLTSLLARTFSNWQKWFFHLFSILGESLSNFAMISRIITLLKFIYALVKYCSIVRTYYCFSLINYW
jgi:hypothetical protein